MALRRTITPGGWSGASGRAITLALLMLVLYPCTRAWAQAPVITIASPLNNTVTNDPMPSFDGSTDEPLEEVTLSIYSGASAEGTPAQNLTVLPVLEAWSVGSASALPDGTYTAEATQTNLALEAGFSTPVTFTVDTVAPLVSLTPIAPNTNDPTPTFNGEAGIASGDRPTVKLQIYAGGTPISGTPVDTLEGTRSGQMWTVGPVPSLADGTYTAQAEQSDEAGNVGLSAPSTFTVDTVAPAVSLTAVPTPSNDPTPMLRGNAGIATGDSGSVRLNLYAGSAASGGPLESIEVQSTGGTWTAGPLGHLADGIYTAQAEQSDDAGNIGLSAPSTFTIDTTPPDITMSSPVQGAVTTGSSQLVEGSAGTSEGDSQSITIKLFAGSSITTQPREIVTVAASNGHWSATLGGLHEGTYTVSSEQSDDAGNTGVSQPVTFTVRPSEPEKGTEPIDGTKVTTTEHPATESPSSKSPAPESSATTTVSSLTPASTSVPPVATFTWFPATPSTGQTVSIISSSTDASSPIATLAWALGGSPFQVGGPVFTTSFATAGTHMVRLQVLAADGLSSTATEQIPVSSPSVVLMQPFPIVRIAGTDTARGAKLRLLTVEAPAGARVTVVCQGHGCPAKPASRIAASPSGGLVLIEFHRFERALRAGAVLEIRVSENGEIGKYTRFQIRRGKLPERTDSCLSPALESMSCPAS